MNVAPTKIQVAAGHSDIRTTNGYCHSENEQVMGIELDGDPQPRSERGIRGIVNALYTFWYSFTPTS